MSFFKKKKSKPTKSKSEETERQSRLAAEIEKMDQERHLDLQLEELTARLNRPVENQQDPVVTETALPEDSKSDPFISESLKDFSTPEFTATMKTGIKNIDVTSDTGTPTDTPRLADATGAKAIPTPPKPLPTEPVVTSRTDLPDVSLDVGLAAPQRLDMSEMRVDVARISADIQSGEELYRRALQRVEGLMGFVEKAEVDFSVLNRLEPENRRLKAKLRTANGDVETYKGKLSLLMADLEDHQERLEEKSKQYEAARAKLVTAASSLQEYQRVLKSTKAEAERYALAVERHKTALSVEGTENKVLREKISELSSALELRQREYLDASKAVESLKNDCADFREQAETYRAEAQDLRITLNTAKRQNNAMKGEMAALHEDIKTFKTQYEFNVISREDQVTDLEAQIAQLKKEAEIKAELAHNAAQDVAALRSIRNEQDIERDRLEKQVALARAEARDIASVVESKGSEKLRAFETEIRDLKAEISARDEAHHQSARHLSEAEREISLLTQERSRLQSRLEEKARELETIVNASPVEKLQSDIANLSDQLRIKDDIVRSAAQDVTRLSQERDAQRAENKRLEDLIHTQTFQLEAANKALREAKISETELDQKYRDIAAALSVNQARRRSENGAENPDIAPDISDDLVGLSGEDIESRIMDYKFGIRKDIV